MKNKISKVNLESPNEKFNIFTEKIKEMIKCYFSRYKMKWNKKESIVFEKQLNIFFLI
jgi:hypothetical protein